MVHHCCSRMQTNGGKAKQLALACGLVRRKTSSSRKRNPSSKATSNTPHNGAARSTIQYCIVLDFEATCWDKQDSVGHVQEIIEFPAVLVDVLTGEVLDQFHSYVCPQYERVLSKFCRELTGITQKQVNAAPPLRHVLQGFAKWLGKVSAKYKFEFVTARKPYGNNSLSCAFCTWTSWDLNVCLPKECSWKSLAFPKALLVWIDAKALFCKVYDKKQCPLKEAMNSIGLNFEGRAHSGIVDARNTAKLLVYIVKNKNVVLRVTSTSIKHRESDKIVKRRRENLERNMAASNNSNKIDIKKIKNDPTPPMCDCLRRVKLNSVSTPGPNLGRSFYSCKICNFFEWKDGLNSNCS
eukprot:m.92175 g.92175  ORF g.92175 m.92175 type:complete len:352 (-) comp13340_c1_seq2:10-1065(-)